MFRWGKTTYFPNSFDFCRRITEILPGRIQQWDSSSSIAEEYERKRLETIETQMETARQKLANSVAEDEKLTTWLNDAKLIKANFDKEVLRRV